MNLREEKHWAYGAYSFALSALNDRPLMSSASVQTDKTIESLQELVREYREFGSTRPCTVEEIKQVKRSDILSLPGQFETAEAVLAQLAEMVMYSYPDDYVQNIQSKLESLTDKAVNQAAKTYFSPNALTWVIVGDLSKIESGIRALNLGTVSVLKEPESQAAPSAIDNEERKP